MFVWKHTDVLMHPILRRQHHDWTMFHHAKLAIQALE